MPKTPSPAHIAKLPQWAQAHIATLAREREAAVETLRHWTDQQTPSPIYMDEHILTGETDRAQTTKRRYITGYQLEIEHGNVHLRLLLRSQGDNGPPRIEMQWSSITPKLGHVGFIPTSFQSADLIASDNLRR
jgi:hypothetical protein